MTVATQFPYPWVFPVDTEVCGSGRVAAPCGHARSGSPIADATDREMWMESRLWTTSACH